MESKTVEIERNYDSNNFRKSLQKSPKLSTNKFRNDQYFSLLDVNLKQVSRGTKIPIQYERHTNGQIKQLTENPPIKTTFPKEEEKKIVPKERNIKSAYPISRLDRILNIRFNEKDDNQHFTQRDTNMPKGYSLYENQVKTEANVNSKDPASIKNIYESIKNKCMNSDIFDQRVTEKNKTTRVREYKSHDIFGRQPVNNHVMTDHYSSNKESESAWKPTFISPTYYNICTTDYSLVNPSIKNITMTKSQVKSCHKFYDPTHRQKGFGEFADLTRITAANFNKGYVKFRNRPQTSFRKTKEICTNFYDSYNSYKGLCGKPFIKKGTY